MCVCNTPGCGWALAHIWGARALHGQAPTGLSRVPAAQGLGPALHGMCQLLPALSLGKTTLGQVTGVDWKAQALT